MKTQEQITAKIKHVNQQYVYQLKQIIEFLNNELESAEDYDGEDFDFTPVDLNHYLKDLEEKNQELKHLIDVLEWVS